jgi:hypothetical protein
MSRIAAIAVVAALVAMPAAALAAQPQENPFLPEQEQPAPAPEAPPVVPTPAPAPAPVETGPTPISRASLALIVLGVAALIGVIWIAIARDARRATAGRVRVRTRDADPFAVPQGGSATRAAPRSRKLSAAERKRRKRGRAR